ncbi:MAG: glycine cleavage system aminomethyltransferase GcvT [Deltaproteobacteria bacterium]|nr:glycine cleavage system aminomethyltransferase GcvT [Deltaproteobacteria bacterium]
MALKHTPFFELHKAAGARLIDFGGWEMPVQYTGIVKEHLACRAAGGLFDVSHMGEVRVTGPRALEAVQRLVTNDVAAIRDGQALYTAMCNDHGGIVDDLIVYRMSPTEILICVNASNREKDFAWIAGHMEEGASAADESDAWGQVAIQGRVAPAVLQRLTDLDLAGLPAFHFASATVAGVPGCVVARTGYTGEDGFEVFLPPEGASAIWEHTLAKGGPSGMVPVGLGARDTLRLEAKYCLYGNDITDDTTPLEAGLGWVVKMDKAVPFIGIEPLRAQKAAGVPQRLVCLVVRDQIARPHHPVLSDGVRVGEVTSGTRSPSLEKNIALAYVSTPLSKVGTHLHVDVRGRIAEAEIVKPPFYTRPY